MNLAKKMDWLEYQVLVSFCGQQCEIGRKLELFSKAIHRNEKNPFIKMITLDYFKYLKFSLLI